MDTASAIENTRFTLALNGDSAGLVSDAEIIKLIEMYPSDWRLAAAALADALAARAINSPTSFAATGQMSVSWVNRASMWQAQAKSLRQQVREDDALAVEIGTVSVTELKRAGIEIVEDEYARPRRSWKLQ